MATVTPAQSLDTVYSNDFSSSVGSEWSHPDRSTTPVGLRTFLGHFSNEEVVLYLDDLAEHCTVTVSFELFVINSWEGSIGTYSGPDIFDVNATTPSDCCEGVNLLHTTFANCACRYQAYPHTYPDVHHAGLTGADEVNTLGYEDDSVYYLSFTFYHSGEDLRLSFSGSPDLQGWQDESWGIDNIVVQMDTSGTHCCRAVRTLPEGFGAGYSFPVSIAVQPNPRADSYVVEEKTPMGWAITAINEGGSFDLGTRTIKWGPFFGEESRTLSYEATPPSYQVGNGFFKGTMTVDGDSELVCGDNVLASGAYHPADTDTDWDIEAEEYTAYAAAWRNGDTWDTGPVPIPSDFVANAGMIWKSGESYHYDASASPPWVGGASEEETLAGGQIEGAFADSSYRAGRNLEVSLEVMPHVGTRAFVVQDAPPAGWIVAEISDGGVWDELTGMVKWGPFADDEKRTLTYEVMPPLGSSGEATFLGNASFNGTKALVLGARTIDSAVGARRGRLLTH
jgi:hypothetical protein